MTAIVNVTFKGGAGTVNVIVYNSAGGIVPQAEATSISETGLINLSDINTDYIIRINGDSPVNGTDVSIDVPTEPPTPDHYYEGLIIGADYRVK